MEEEFRALLLTAVAPVLWEVSGQTGSWEQNGQPLQWVVGAVTQYVGNRVNWGANPQGAGYPAVVLNTISDNDGLHHKGSDGLFQGRVQVDCYALTYGQAKILSRAVRTALQAYRGGGFRLIAHVGTHDSREGGSNEAERPFRVSMDFTTNWRA